MVSASPFFPLFSTPFVPPFHSRDLYNSIFGQAVIEQKNYQLGRPRAHVAPTSNFSWKAENFFLLRLILFSRELCLKEEEKK